MLKTSILILTHNAPKYVEETLRTLGDVTNPVDRAQCEVIVLDNASDKETRQILRALKNEGYIDKLEFSEENTFFARGNNLAAKLADAGSRYFLLLNSDVSIRNPEWLSKLYFLKEKGGYVAAAYGLCAGPKRADGYCFIVDREVYERFKLDENFQWWGGVTKLQCEILKSGGSILAIDNHDSMVYHYGGKSGRTFKQAKKVSLDSLEVLDCFENSTGKVVTESLDHVGIIGRLNKRWKKIRTLLARV